SLGRGGTCPYQHFFVRHTNQRQPAFAPEKRASRNQQRNPRRNPIVNGGAAVAEVKAALGKTGPGEKAGGGADGAGGQKPLQSGSRADDEFAEENRGNCDWHGMDEVKERIVPFGKSCGGSCNGGLEFVQRNGMMRENISD